MKMLLFAPDRLINQFIHRQIDGPSTTNTLNFQTIFFIVQNVLIVSTCKDFYVHIFVLIDGSLADIILE